MRQRRRPPQIPALSNLPDKRFHHWTPAMELRLLEGLLAGHNLTKLSATLERQGQAVRSHLYRLGWPTPTALEREPHLRDALRRELIRRRHDAPPRPVSVPLAATALRPVAWTPDLVTELSSMPRHRRIRVWARLSGLAVGAAGAMPADVRALFEQEAPREVREAPEPPAGDDVEVRAWAQRYGLPIGRRGRVAGPVVRAFVASGGGPPPASLTRSLQRRGTSRAGVPVVLERLSVGDVVRGPSAVVVHRVSRPPRRGSTAPRTSCAKTPTILWELLADLSWGAATGRCEQCLEIEAAQGSS